MRDLFNIKPFSLLLALALLSMTACGDEEPQGNTLELNFSGKYDNEALLLGNTYELNGDNVAFNVLQFYVSEIALVKDDGTEVEILDIGFLNFYNNHSTSTQAGQETLTIDGVPDGQYTAIQLGVGVPADLNNTDPSSYKSGHPLSRSEMYWSWNAGYIFSMIEATLDTSLNAVPDLFLTYHSGANDLYGTTTLPINLEIIEGQTASLNLSLDAKQIFMPNGEFYDVINNPQSHTDGAKFQIALDIITNLRNAISLE